METIKFDNDSVPKRDKLGTFDLKIKKVFRNNVQDAHTYTQRS